MKVTLAMAISLNGMICLEDGSEPFLSVAGGELIAGLIKRTGSLIWGRRTYEKVLEHYNGRDEMDLGPWLQGLPKVVVSHDPRYETVDDYMHAVSPQAAVDLLIEKGLRETIVVGGSTLNAAFLAAGLVDEIVLDVEPVIVGKGISLFAPGSFESRLTLLSIEEVNQGELLLRYKVVK